MNLPLSERRQIENEMIFRRANERISDELDDLNELHTKNNNPEMIRDGELLLHFMCECSDENCKARILIKLSAYKKIHENRNAFIVKHEHQVNEIEKIVTKEDNYIVVEKNNTVAEPNDNLNKTSVENT